MSRPDLLERTRMALAEVGYGPEVIVSKGNGRHTYTEAVTPLDAWRASSIAKGLSDRQVCHECFMSVTFKLDNELMRAAIAACLADRPLVRDCGVAR